jgi:hypothetical protein
VNFSNAMLTYLSVRPWFRGGATNWIFAEGAVAAPGLVAEQIRQIVEGSSWKLRYPVGSDAAAALRWRAKTTDEDWVSLVGGGDREWAAAVKRELGLDLEL